VCTIYKRDVTALLHKLCLQTLQSFQTYEDIKEARTDPAELTFIIFFCRYFNSRVNFGAKLIIHYRMDEREGELIYRYVETDRNFN
jgi:hypothetical protein